MIKRQLLPLLCIVLFVFSFLGSQYVHANSTESHTIIFSDTTFLTPYEIEFTFEFEIELDYPQQIPIGGSKNVTFLTERKYADAVSRYVPFTPQTKTFLTPIGDTAPIQIAVFVGDLWYYVTFRNATSWLYMSVEGNGQVSTDHGESWLRWKHSGEDASSAAKGHFIVSHTGSSEETLTIEITPKYTASMTISQIGQYGIIITEKNREIELIGTPISKELQIVKSSSKTCFIATATYGSELSPEVQFLRRFRDQEVLSTFAGSQFMTVFNSFYYSFSPSIASVIDDSPLIRDVMKVVLHPLMRILQLTEEVNSVLGIVSEFAIVLSGLIASSLIGIIYLMPLSLIISLISKRPPQNVLKTIRLLSIVLTCSLALILCAYLISSSVLMMFATGTLVVTTLCFSAEYASKGIMKLLELFNQQLASSKARDRILL